MDSIQFALPWVKPVLTTSFNRDSRASCFDIQHSINIRVTCWVYREKSETVAHVLSKPDLQANRQKLRAKKTCSCSVFQNSSRTTSLRGLVGGCWRMESQVFFLKPWWPQWPSFSEASRPPWDSLTAVQSCPDWRARELWDISTTEVSIRHQ